MKFSYRQLNVTNYLSPTCHQSDTYLTNFLKQFFQTDQNQWKFHIYISCYHVVCSECFMYRSDPNDPKFGNRGLEQSKCPVCNNWSEIVCRSYHQMNSVEEKKEEIRKVVDIFDRKSWKFHFNSHITKKLLTHTGSRILIFI